LSANSILFKLTLWYTGGPIKSKPLLVSQHIVLKCQNKVSFCYIWVYCTWSCTNIIF